MFRRSEPKSDEVYQGSGLTLGMVIVAMILMVICISSLVLINRQKKASPTVQAANPLPESLPAARPVDQISVYLPLIHAEYVSNPLPAPAARQVWKVTEINRLGYELGGQRYDLASFQRDNSQETAQGYCLNRGWEVPILGSEYVLNAEGIFVPLQEAPDHPLQRFAKIP